MSMYRIQNMSYRRCMRCEHLRLDTSGARMSIDRLFCAAEKIADLSGWLKSKGSEHYDQIYPSVGSLSCEARGTLDKDIVNFNATWTNIDDFCMRDRAFALRKLKEL